jgi:hypothetical protein
MEQNGKNTDEHPRLGLTQVDPFDRALTELRQSMD